MYSYSLVVDIDIVNTGHENVHLLRNAVYNARPEAGRGPDVNQPLVEPLTVLHRLYPLVLHAQKLADELERRRDTLLLQQGLRRRPNTWHTRQLLLDRAPHEVAKGIVGHLTVLWVECRRHRPKNKLSVILTSFVREVAALTLHVTIAFPFLSVF